MTIKEFNNAVSKQVSFLYEKAMLYTKNHQDALDLVQDTMMKSLSNFHNYDGCRNLRGWLYVILKNTYINQYHKRKNLKKYKSSKEISDYMERTSLGSFYPTAYSNIELEEVMAEVKQLPKIYYLPFIMHCQGYKYEEIAKKLDIPLGTIKTRIHKARKMIKKKLKKLPSYKYYGVIQ